MDKQKKNDFVEWKFGGLADKLENQAQRKGCLIQNVQRHQRLADSICILHIFNMVTDAEYAKICKRIVKGIQKDLT